MAGDDTTTRVLQILRALTHDDPFWKEFATTDLAKAYVQKEGKEKANLAALVGQTLDLVSLTKSRKRVPKKTFNTTVCHGKTDIHDPKSTIVVYRSHFGQFGDLVQQLVSMRDEEYDRLDVLSDLASFNNIDAPPGLAVRRYGCTSHARRRFAKEPREDEDWSQVFINQFGLIYCHEDMLDAEGRRKTNVQGVRDKCSRKVWSQMFVDAKKVIPNFSRDTILGDAAHYLVDNFPALTAYLDNPNMMHTKDLYAYYSPIVVKHSYFVFSASQGVPGLRAA